MTRPLLVLLGLIAAAPASALDPYMWGVGPRIGTMVIPGSYPWKFPPRIMDEPLGEPDRADMRVKNDVSLGLDAVYYINGSSRTAVSGGFGFGGGYFDANALFKYGWVTQTGAMDFLLGGGAGFGTATFSSRHNEQEQLRLPYYPLRGEASALIRDGARGYQGTVFAQYNLPANHHYTNVDGAPEDVGIGFYGTLGIELTVLFGDMTPPTPRRRPSTGPSDPSGPE